MIAVVAGLIFLNALFSETEFALLSLRDPQVADLRDRCWIHEFEPRGVQLPRGPYTTVGGLVLDRLGRLPTEGDLVRAGPWTIEVTNVQDHRIAGVTIRRRSTRRGRAPLRRARPCGS